MKLAESDRVLVAFSLTLVAIVLLSKIGGSGGDLAIMTALVAVLGTLAQGLRRTPGANVEQADTVNQRPQS